MMKAIRVLQFMALCGLVAGCGGGGGGGAAVVTATAVIDSGNAQAIAAAVVSGNLALMDAVGSAGGPLSAQAAGDGGLVMYRFVPQMLTGGAARKAILGVTRQSNRVGPDMAFGPAVEPCNSSGTVTLSGNVAHPPDLGAGDTVNATFTDCDDGDGFVMNGVMRLRLTALSGDFNAGAFLLAADATFTSLSVTVGADTGVLNGSASVTFDTTDATREITRLVADSLRLTDGADIFQLNDYDVGTEVVLATNQYTLDVTGYLQDSSAFAGIVRLDTLAPFAGDVGGYPAAGRLRVTGANDSAVDIEALDSVQARLSIDPDGNGTTDEVRDVNWSELIP